MNQTLILAWEGFLRTYELWVMYLAIMALKGARDRGVLPKPAMIAGFPLLLIGYAWDWFVNVTVMYAVFRDQPAFSTRTIKLWRWSWTTPSLPWEIVTARLQRYADGPDCRNRRWAWWIDRNFLWCFDPTGYHVKWPEAEADPNTYLSHIKKGPIDG